MTLKNIFKNTESASGDKAFDRYHQTTNQGYYGGHGGYNFHQAPPNYHNPHVYKHYSFSQHTPSSTGGKGGSGAAMSALTLLSFLFFLNILQQCLKDHMMAMNPQIAVMTAGREELNLQTDAMNSKQSDTDMYLIQKPKDKSYGIGRAYPLEFSDEYDDNFHPLQYPGNLSNAYDGRN